MKTLFRLLTLFMTVPIAELFFLLQVQRLFDQWTNGYGLLATMALIVVTAVVGSYLAKREGLSAWRRLQGRLGEGGLPGNELLDAVIILIAGAFLITPGVLTDLVGFIGLIPVTRGAVRRLAKRRLKKAMREGRLQTGFGMFGGMGGPPPGGSHAGGFGPEGGAAAREEPAVGGTPSERGPAPEDDSRASASGTPFSRAAEASRGSSRDDTLPEEASARGSADDDSIPSTKPAEEASNHDGSQPPPHTREGYS